LRPRRWPRPSHPRQVPQLDPARRRNAADAATSRSRRHSWGSNPSQLCSRHGWLDVSAAPGPHAFCFAAPLTTVFVAGPSDRIRYARARRSIMGSESGFGASLPSAIRIGLYKHQVGRPLLPWGFPLAGLWTPGGRSRMSSSSHGSSVSGVPLPVPIRSWGLLQRRSAGKQCQIPRHPSPLQRVDGTDALPIRRYFAADQLPV